MPISRLKTISILTLAGAFITLAMQAPATAAKPKPALKGKLTVLAAASLTKVLPQLGNAFRKTNPGIRFSYSFAGSSTLAQQILAGAPADLFFAAGPAPMETVRAGAMLAGNPSNFTSNSLVIAVPKGNPANISTLADLARPGIKLVLCAVQVPCGSASAKVLAQVKVEPVSLESDVKSVLSKVAMGEADAGLIYRTDVTSEVSAIDFPESAQAINTYPAAVVKGSKAASAARAFISFVRSAKGQAILKRAGFGRP